MANSATAFDADYCGAIAGALMGRGIKSTSSFTAVAAAALAFATEVDAVMGAVGALGAGKEALLLKSICQAIVTNRGISSTTATDYLAMAQAVKAEYDLAAANLT